MTEKSQHISHCHILPIMMTSTKSVNFFMTNMMISRLITCFCNWQRPIIRRYRSIHGINILKSKMQSHILRYLINKR